MMRVALLLTSFAAALAGAQPASAQQLAARGGPERSSERLPSFMRIYGTAQPPYGFVRLCESQPELCDTRSRTSPAAEGRFNATPERLSELDEVNRTVNTTIQPLTDMEIYGVSEFWTLPADKGDCEDYALLKREVLIRRGWPSSALLLTVVRDEKGEGHAVLTARTQQGDFILDNKVTDVRLWYRTSYDFVMRQSYLNPREWVSLDNGSGTSPASLAGVSAGR